MTTTNRPQVDLIDIAFIVLLTLLTAVILRYIGLTPATLGAAAAIFAYVVGRVRM